MLVPLFATAPIVISKGDTPFGVLSVVKEKQDGGVNTDVGILVGVIDAGSILILISLPTALRALVLILSRSPFMIVPILLIFTVVVEFPVDCIGLRVNLATF